MNRIPMPLPEERPTWQAFADRVSRTGGWTWHYESGVVLKALMDAAEWTGRADYGETAKKAVRALVSADGRIAGYRREEYNLDQVNPGRVLQAVAAAEPGPGYERALAEIARQLEEQPRNRAGGWWHKAIYPHQMWLDGIYMASPWAARWGLERGEGRWLDEVWRQVSLVAAHTRDEATGLYYHGWDSERAEAWADPATGRSRVIWGRGVGWWAMALVDLLALWPRSHPARGEIAALARDLLQAVVNVADPESGLWHQVLDQGGRPGNYPEASASAMMVYVLARGVGLGVAGREALGSAEKAYRSVSLRLCRRDDEGELHLTHCNAVSGLGGRPYRDGSYDYYVTAPTREDDPKAVAALIMAGVALEAARAGEGG